MKEMRALSRREWLQITTGAMLGLRLVPISIVRLDPTYEQKIALVATLIDNAWEDHFRRWDEQLRIMNPHSCQVWEGV